MNLILHLIKFRHRIRLFFNPSNVVIQGECRKCGTCCRNLILVDGKKIVSSEEEFERLIKRVPDYAMFSIRPESPNKDGDLIFHCSNLNHEGTCSIHATRPRICEGYPSKAMFVKDGNLFEKCGYYVKPAVSFQDILDSS